MRASDEPNPDGRPSPDALLAAVERERPGSFKIFLGAAPGVGKTYEMLRVAHAKRAEGVDVVIGIIEAHGRAETAALAKGLEVVPSHQLAYKDRMLEEMDLDAILRRHPRLVLVDELAHTNAEGSQHPKRYLDVEELLSAGIDVYATVNIQHLESLNDVVAEITRVRVRETLPDSVLATADEVELIDLTPDALIARLKDGKVYGAAATERALQHYFKPGNLTALRELALRRTAQRVDDQMLSDMQAHAIEGPWAATERVLVCINEQPASAGLIRYAHRVAERLRAKWSALYVESSRHESFGEQQRDRIAGTLRLAEQLGGEAITIPGRRIADEVLAYARTNNFTHIVIGKSSRSRWVEILHGSVVHDLVRASGSISVHVIADTSRRDEESASAVVTGRQPRFSDPLAYVVSAGAVVVAVGVGLLINSAVSVPNLSHIFLTAVLFSAVRFGLWPSLATALMSALAYNFFFLPPVYSLTIADPANVLSLVFFLVVAGITSHLAGQAQRQGRTLSLRSKVTAELYAFSRKVAGTGSLEDLLWAISYQITLMLRANVVVLLPGETKLVVRSGYPPEDTLDEADMAAAHWTWTHNHAAGRGSDTLPGTKRLFLPLRTQRGLVGVVGIERAKPELLTPDERRLLDALLDQAAVAIERVRLAEDVDQVRLQAETERLRNALLTSISHDLRTPLTSIIGALTSLNSFGALYDAPAREELIGTALEEAERLNRFVGNLLDMTRLESGGVAPKLVAIDLEEVVTSAVARAPGILRGHRVEVSVAPDLPFVQADPVLLEQVLLNLLDNAAKYTPADSMILIRAPAEQGPGIIEVIDEGPGIPAAVLDAIFDKFTRLYAEDRQQAGTGLGLPICRGFLLAMGGNIEAANRTDRSGAIFTITLPVSGDDGISAEARDADGR